MQKLPELQDLQSIFDVVPSPIFVKDRSHQIVLLNTSACALFGHSREVLLSFKDTELFPPDQVKTFHEADDRAFADGVDDESEEEVTDATGVTRSVITRKRMIRLGEEDLLVAVVTDVTVRREAEAHNQYLAFHDTLTGLPNRALLGQRIEQALRRGARGSRGCALIYVDLDRFKEVNDAHGHSAGDELIREFASRLAEIVRASDTVARLGGDEFAILLTNANRAVDANEICRRVLTASSQAFQVSCGQVFVSASVGVAFAPKERIDQIELQRRADVALYQAKNDGRGCARIFTVELDEGNFERRRLEREMREALAKGVGFEVHYQPLLSNRGERVVAMEALVRWRNPRLGLLAPTSFIRLAEDTGLIVPLGELVLQHAARMIARWPDVAIAVNVSPVQLRQPDLTKQFLAIIDNEGLARGRLQVEVTESAILEVNSSAAETLESLREAGVAIVLDDFGTGYSSLSHLQRLHVDKVKIDRSFVNRLGQAEDSDAIVHAVASLCRKLGIAVAAEGVETEEQRRFLRASACTELQGYLFSCPLDEEAATAFLDEAIWGGRAAA